MKIAVTAASGKLGGEIIRQLKDEIGAENVTGIARTPEKAQSLGVKIFKGDYNNKEEFNAAFQGIDAALVISGMDDPAKRIIQHKGIFEAAKDAGVKKVVYTSIFGVGSKTSFDAIINSNRQTEQDLINSGLDWAIGRNGLYIEPDLEYLNNYIKSGEISNCGGDGKCAYTSRSELARAYVKMLTDDKHNGNIYSLAGKSITQSELTNEINKAYGFTLSYRPVGVEEYRAERSKELGEFMGMVVSGIYEGIRNGAFDVSSDYSKATGRGHKTVEEMIVEFQSGQLE